MSPSSARAGSEALVDADRYSAWVAPLTEGPPEAVLEFGKDVSFDGLAVFSRCTDARGTGGGNNAVRKIGLAVSDSVVGPWRDLGEAAIDGPIPMCFKKTKGQICVFINHAEPTVVSVAPVRARALRIRLQDAYWADEAPAEWKSSVAISEVLIYSSAEKR